MQCQQEGHVRTFLFSIHSQLAVSPADAFPVPFTQIARDCPTNVAPVETAALARLPFTVVDPGRHAEDLSRCFFSRRLPSIVPTLLYQLFPRFLQSYLSSVTKCRVLDSLQRESTIENPFVGRRHVLRPRPRGAADERLRASRARPIITVLLGSYTLFIDQHGVVTQAAYTDEHSFVWLPRWRARTDHHQQRFATGRVNRRAQEGRVDPPRPGHDRQDPVKKV